MAVVGVIPRVRGCVEFVLRLVLFHAGRPDARDGVHSCEVCSLSGCWATVRAVEVVLDSLKLERSDGPEGLGRWMDRTCSSGTLN